jgi:hypothetical protein
MGRRRPLKNASEVESRILPLNIGTDLHQSEPKLLKLRSRDNLNWNI